MYQFLVVFLRKSLKDIKLRKKIKQIFYKHIQLVNYNTQNNFNLPLRWYDFQFKKNVHKWISWVPLCWLYHPSAFQTSSYCPVQNNDLSSRKMT